MTILFFADQTTDPGTGERCGRTRIVHAAQLQRLGKVVQVEDLGVLPRSAAVQIAERKRLKFYSSDEIKHAAPVIRATIERLQGSFRELGSEAQSDVDKARVMPHFRRSE